MAGWSEESAKLAREVEVALLTQIRDKAASKLDSEQLQMVAEAYAAVVSNPVPAESPKRSGKVHFQ